MWEVALKEKSFPFGWKKHARISRWRGDLYLTITSMYLYTSAEHFNDSFLNTKLTYKQGEALICFSYRYTYVGQGLRIQHDLNLRPPCACLTERSFPILFFCSEEEEEQEMFNPTPTVKGKSNAYLTISLSPSETKLKF